MKKNNLQDISFLLIVKIDTIERLENTLQIVRFLNDNFDTNIHLWEFAPLKNGILKCLIPENIKYQYREDYDPILHRTRYLNDMIDYVDTKFVSVWDVDVVVPIEQINKAVYLLREGCDFVFPYNKKFLDTTSELRRLYIRNDGNMEILTSHTDFMIELYTPNPVGGAFFANRISYIQSGKENENFYGWGFEDGERYNRWVVNKFSIKKVDGPLFHLTHPRGVNSHIESSDLIILKKRELLSAIKNNHGNKIY